MLKQFTGPAVLNISLQVHIEKTQRSTLKKNISYQQNCITRVFIKATYPQFVISSNFRSFPLFITQQSLLRDSPLSIDMLKLCTKIFVLQNLRIGHHLSSIFVMTMAPLYVAPDFRSSHLPTCQQPYCSRICLEELVE